MKAATSLPDTLDEASFTRNVIDYARLRGWRTAHFRPGRTVDGGWKTPMQGHKGFPDVVFARRGRVIFAELKAHRGVLSPDQKAWLAELAPAGSIADVDVFVWRPRDWDTIVKVLR
jgi:hypothetical protein